MFEKQLLKLIKEAGTEAIQEHLKCGRSVPTYRDGHIVMLWGPEYAKANSRRMSMPDRKFAKSEFENGFHVVYARVKEKDPWVKVGSATADTAADLMNKLESDVEMRKQYAGIKEDVEADVPVVEDE